MSEEILKALMQLFAIIAKQDEGLSSNERDYVKLFLRQQLSDNLVSKYIDLFDEFVGGSKEKSKDESSDGEPVKPKLTSVKDSVITLGICKKINKTLTQKQKIVVLVRLFELINSDKKFTSQRMSIIDTVAKVFNINKEEYSAIENFVFKEDYSQIENSEILIIGNENIKVNPRCKSIISTSLEGNIYILRIESVELYFIRYDGSVDLQLNGLPINNKRIHLFASGSILKPPKGKPIFFSDIASKFLTDESQANIIFNVKNVKYIFPNGNIGLQEFNLSEISGRLVGIMGSSGAGKTTLLNVLSGIEAPTEGEVIINGINIHKETERVKGIIGYIPQDDLLIEELTVYQNLYYNAKLIFKDFSELDIQKRVLSVIQSLGLMHIKDLKVGNPLNKKISGGQRKRLNIGLELIREPSVLFVDEPTSGLSSRDSENVMELLRELTLKGKLIFVVIHQPSSNIYKMFDNVVILDTGGYQIFYGNPVQAVIHFKERDRQVNSSVGECVTCGNVNPESIFNIIEARIVDEYGRFTENRKVLSSEWHEAFREKNIIKEIKEEVSALPGVLKIPSKFKQIKVFFLRDLFSKLSNTQYLVINFLEAPIIGFLLAFILRYIVNPDSDNYIFMENENIMPYVFMSVIVSIFLGLIVSAEEIFKDRKILKRESFLNLSRSSYLLAKISILVILSAIQSFLFVIVANSMLELHGMYYEYWIVLFSASVFSNLLGLNISATFNSAVTIYILIPFLVIPQMILAGAMFDFDKINKIVGGGGEKTPIISEIMVSKLGFEALLINQFKNNKFEKIFYELEKKESFYNYRIVYSLPKIKEILDNYKVRVSQGSPESDISEKDLDVLRNEIINHCNENKEIKFDYIDKLNKKNFNLEVAENAVEYIEELSGSYRTLFAKYDEMKEEIIDKYQQTEESTKEFQKLKDEYSNDNLASYAKRAYALYPVVVYNKHLVQKINPIFLEPRKDSFIDFRTHFLSPKKYFLGGMFDSFSFNVILIWIYSLILYFVLYYNLFAKMIKGISRITDKIKIPVIKINLLKSYNFKKIIKNEKPN